MKKRKTVKKRYVIALVIVIAGLITLWRILNAPVPTYQTLIVRPGDLQQSVLATGKLDALRKVDVGAQVSGQLKTLSVAIGDKIKKDQLLGVIDPEQAENQIKEVEATLMELRAQRQQAEAELKLARVTYSRQQRLAQTQAVSQQDLDTAATEMAVKQAQIGTIDAQIKRNQASLDTAKTNLDYTRIVAPMAGEVTQITTLQGQTVIAAQQDPVGDNRYKVKLLRNGETREREVTIGARNDTDVEIVKGLEAGDEVVIGEAKPGAAQ
ncbi:TPA: macrolide transporter subunit MacA [Escherichia coli]|nr:macrolide transporter subunit MacA [Escherichia coli]